jgi:hypothetical protein
MSINLKRTHFCAILRAQCAAVGVNYDVFFKPFKYHKEIPKRWHLKHTWTTEQQGEFIIWLTRYFMVQFRVHSKQAENMAATWISDYGWKVKDKEDHNAIHTTQ